ncbi:MAG: ABC transporter permease [Anaerolineaceae bacterium]|nr:ABC transporter permease [Anaerolineaceae bacterium]
MISPVKNHQNKTQLILRPILASIFGLLAGAVFVFFTDVNPLKAMGTLLNSGFGCNKNGFCAIWTMFQYATPLILTGLSALMAFRVRIFSIGQAGQMVLGAGLANWAAYNLAAPGFLHPASALLCAMLASALYALVPAVLKVYLDVNEIISTIVLNSIAGFLVGLVPGGWGRRIPESAKLPALVHGTKFNSGFFIAIAALILIYIFLWHTSTGYEIRMAGQSPKFAKAGGVSTVRSVMIAMAISGALAGLAGGIEVLGVHYNLVSNFMGSDNFDGLVIALLGQVHPVGVFISALFLGGIRLGAMTGLSIQLGVPRSLGGIMIAVMVIFMGMDSFNDLLGRLIPKRRK